MNKDIKDILNELGKVQHGSQLEMMKYIGKLQQLRGLSATDILSSAADILRDLAEKESQNVQPVQPVQEAETEPTNTPGTVYVNLVGGPCCGKSTTAAGLFALLKLKQEFSTELVTEAVKEFVYDENKQGLDDQLLITANQNHSMRRLNGKVQMVITDASLLNGIVYNRFYGTNTSKEATMIDDLAKTLFKGYNNVVFLLPRKPKYDQYGRTQNEEEAKQIDKIFLDVLQELNVPYYDMRVWSHEQLPAQIEMVMQRYM